MWNGGGANGCQDKGKDFKIIISFKFLKKKFTLI